jgi:Ca2+-binding EF-hand superfamily protein
MRSKYLFPLIAVASLAGAPPLQAPPPGADQGKPRGGKTFISPMGEPFRGPGDSEDLVKTWFDGADSTHDGMLFVAEMEADAARFYTTLELNHDGEIDPAEMEIYETRIAPELHQLSVIASLSYRPSGSAMRSRNPGRRDARAVALLNLPQPVASADFNFNRGVSAKEFKQAADQRFALLDANHDGKIETTELATFRPVRPPLPAIDQGKSDED